MAAKTTQKVCRATCLTGDLFDVFYPDQSCDTEVSGRFLDRLTKEGWTVHVYDRETHERYTLDAEVTR